MPTPGTLIIAALTTWGIGGLCFAAAGITLLTNTLRRTFDRPQDRP